MMAIKLDLDAAEAVLANQAGSAAPALDIDSVLAKARATIPEPIDYGDDILKRRAAEARTKEEAFRSGLHSGEERARAAEAALENVTSEASALIGAVLAKEFRRWSEALALVTENDPAASLCLKLLSGSRMAPSDIVAACEHVANKDAISPAAELAQIMATLPTIRADGLPVSSSKGYRDDNGEYHPSEAERAAFRATLGIPPEGGKLRADHAPVIVPAVFAAK